MNAALWFRLGRLVIVAPRYQHHADLERKFHLSNLFRFPEPPLHTLDHTNRRIVENIQSDARITNVELAKRVGISDAPCLRRHRSLEASNVITGYHAVLDGKALGFEVEAFSMINLRQNEPKFLAAFEAELENWPEVRECHMLIGNPDFIIRIVAKSVSHFRRFISVDLITCPNIESIRTSLSIRHSKYAVGIPSGGAA